jgi:Sec-independent protein translocase protein TatA
MWIWIAVVVVAVFILGAAVVPLVGRLAGLQRAAVKLQRRQGEAMRLQQGAETLQQTLLGLQERAEEMQLHIQSIKPGS